MSEDETVDYATLRARFPWVGLAHTDETDLSARYREIQAPVGYVDATIIAMAERLRIPDIATVDFKMVGMMTPVCTIKPLRWVLQEE